MMDIKGLQVVVLLVLLRYNLPLNAQNREEGVVEEYCQFDVFQPTCNNDNVIIMETAHYGRMALGKCVSVDLGYIGCSVDVLKNLDAECSGKDSCSITVGSFKFPEESPCLDELLHYLTASYHCQEVYTPPKRNCYSPETIQTGTSIGYIASVTSQTTSCGYPQAPWILSAEPGQQIILSMVDFSWKNTSKDHVGSASCESYGYILDMMNDDVISICGGGQREKKLFQSGNHQVQIVLNEHAVGQHRFLIRYEATGCPDIKQPSHTWLKKDGDKVTIGCTYSVQNWTVKCIGNTWLGFMGTCPEPTTQETQTIPETTTTPEQNSGWGDLPHVSNNHVLAFAMGCMTLIICCSVIVLGIYCSKRYEAKIKHYRSVVLERTVFPEGAASNSCGATLDRETLVFRPMPHSSSFHTIGNNSTLPIEFSTERANINMLSRQPQVVANNPTVPQNPPNYTNNTSKPPNYNNSFPSLPDYSSDEPFLPNYSNNVQFNNEPADYFGNEQQHDHNTAVDDEPNKYYVLENPRETGASDREQVYQSIHHLQGDLLG